VVLRASNATSRESLRRPCCGARSLHQQGPWPAPPATPSRGRGAALAAPSSGRSSLTPARSLALIPMEVRSPEGRDALAGHWTPAEGLAAPSAGQLPCRSGSCLPWHPMLCRIGRPRVRIPPRTPKPQVYCLSGKTSIFRSNRQWQPQHLN
jgi:hypothetical protein